MPNIRAFNWRPVIFAVGGVAETVPRAQRSNCTATPGSDVHPHRRIWTFGRDSRNSLTPASVIPRSFNKLSSVSLSRVAFRGSMILGPALWWCWLWESVRARFEPRPMNDCTTTAAGNATLSLPIWPAGLNLRCPLCDLFGGRIDTPFDRCRDLLVVGFFYMAHQIIAGGRHADSCGSA